MSNLFENPSTFQELNPGECCVDDKFVSDAVIAYNATTSLWEITISFNDGTTLVEPYPAAFTDDIKVSAFARHPDALTNPTYVNTIRITLSNATTFDLDLAFLSGIESAQLNINVLTVTKSGDDTTAAVLKYDFHEPWKNPTVAMAAAVTGDVVVVYPGTYQIGSGGYTDDGNQHMVKDGVTLYMMPGAIIHYTNATAPISLPFSDGGNYHKFKIRGKGQFIFAADTSTSVDYFNLTTNGSTIVDWEFDSISTNRRFGGPLVGAEPNFASWRMVGREYTNGESGIFQFEFPVTSLNKFIDIDIEKVTIVYTNASKPQWTVNKLANLSGGSIVNIRYGKVSYPNAVSLGGFHENEACDENCTINLTIDNIHRTGVSTIADYIVYHNTDSSKGTYTIKNINSNKGLIKSNAIAGGQACRTAYLHGNIRTTVEETVDMYIMHFDTTDMLYKIEMDLVHSGTGEYDLGIYAKDSYKVKLSGYLRWANTLHVPIHVELGVGVKSLTLWNFMLSEVAHTYCAKNINVGAVDIHVMNTFSNKDIDAGGGGSTLTQRIGTITVDPLV